MTIRQNESEVLVRAKAYPYFRPKGSYLLEPDRVTELKGKVLDGRLDKYIPVLAYGSNAAPEQLRRKLSNFNKPIAVLTATVKGLDVIFAARFARYGAIPATITSSPGTTLHTHVVMLTKEQLKLIHKTERPEYRFGKLNKPILIDRFGFSDHVYAYLHDTGFSVDGGFVAYEEVSAENRYFLSMRHDEMLSLVHKELGVQDNLDAFILAMVRSKAIRSSNDAALRRTSAKVSVDSFHQILPQKTKKKL